MKFTVTVVAMGGGWSDKYFDKLRDAIKYCHFRCSEPKNSVRYCNISRKWTKADCESIKLYVRPTNGGRVLISRNPTNHYEWDIEADGVNTFDITDKFDHSNINEGANI